METVQTDKPQCKVLLVDDDADCTAVIDHYLHDSRIELTMARTGKEGIEAFKKDQFDLVLMDIQMPEIDGCAATLAIRHWELQANRPLTPIAALTSFSTRVALARIFEAGCTHYLMKPISRLTLLQTVSQYARKPAATV